MKQEILKWLDGKLNYANYKSEKDTFESYNRKFSNLLFQTRLSFDDLHATDCYIITNDFDIVTFKHEKPRARSKLFKEFNIRRNEYVYDKVKLKEAVKNFTPNDNTRNRSIILELLKELNHAYSSNNTFISKFDKYNYKNIFSDIKQDDLPNFEKLITDSFINNEADLAKFDTIIASINTSNRNLKEVGIFYPFKIDNDIFSKNYYPYEINHIRFQKNDEYFIDKVHRYYSEYGMNSNKSEPIFTLKKYFTYAGFTFHPEVAYFNPIINLTKYKEEYSELRTHIKIEGLNFSNFICELFDLLNKAQFGVVKFQQENVINEIVTHNKGRQFSIKKMSELQLKKLHNNELNLFNCSYSEYATIMYTFTQQNGSFRFTKNTKIDDLEGTHFWTPDIKQKAQIYLDDFLMIQNKHKYATLQFVYDHYKRDILQIVKKYKIKNSEKEILLSMLLDLIYFYKIHKEKLTNSYNKTIDKIYKNYIYQDIDTLIDYDFQKKFIKKYQDEFDKYKPMEIIGMDGNKKYMMTY